MIGWLLIDLGMMVRAAAEREGNTYVQRFRGGLVLKAHRLFYHSTLGLRVIKKKRREGNNFNSLKDVRTGNGSSRG